MDRSDRVGYIPCPWRHNRDGRLIAAQSPPAVGLGTYNRPAREQRIVMFLDIASSTRPAEEMGELRVHDLITAFF